MAIGRALDAGTLEVPDVLRDRVSGAAWRAAWEAWRPGLPEWLSAAAIRILALAASVRALAPWRSRRRRPAPAAAMLLLGVAAWWGASPSPTCPLTSPAPPRSSG